jgi:hypothetical protein
MTRITHHRIHCTTESAWKDWWLPEDDPAPTTCPDDSAHEITAGSAVEKETVGPAEVAIKNDDGTSANFPQTAGGTPIVQPNVVPPGYYFYGSGAFDDITGKKRGIGEQIVIEVEGPNAEDTIEGQFFDHVYILGGFLEALNPGIRDWCSLTMIAPASAPEDRTGTNDGNANKINLGPFSIIIPAPGGDGDWNVDGSTFDAGELNKGLVPVPNGAGIGYWHWDPTQNPSIYPVANPASPDGAFDLYDGQIELARQANRYPVTAPGNVTPAAAVKGKKVLPHWKWKFEVHREEAGTVQVAVRLDTARASTL